MPARVYHSPLFLLCIPGEMGLGMQKEGAVRGLGGGGVMALSDSFLLLTEKISLSFPFVLSNHFISAHANHSDIYPVPDTIL